MVQRVAGGKVLPAAVLRQMVARTDGVPLFVEELTKTVLEADGLQEASRARRPDRPLPALAIPATLQDALRARLDRLPEGKVVAQLGAVLGRTFAYELLQAVAPLDELTLGQVWGSWYRPRCSTSGACRRRPLYVFKHALIQEAAYQSLAAEHAAAGPSAHCPGVESSFPGLAETQPELLAQHYTEAGLVAAGDALLAAGGRSKPRRARPMLEAISHCTTGLEVLKTLPDTPDAYPAGAGPAAHPWCSVDGIKGYAAPEVGARLRPRPGAVSSGRGHARALRCSDGTGGRFIRTGGTSDGPGVGGAGLTLAQRLHDPARLLRGPRVLGATCITWVSWPLARTHLEQALTPLWLPASTIPAVTRRQDPRGDSSAYAASTLWLLGYPDQALTRIHEALTLAQELSHPLAWRVPCAMLPWLHQLRREWATPRSGRGSAGAVDRAGVCVLAGVGNRFQQGWALAVQGQDVEGDGPDAPGPGRLSGHGGRDWRP